MRVQSLVGVFLRFFFYYSVANNSSVSTSVSRVAAREGPRGVTAREGPVLIAAVITARGQTISEIREHNRRPNPAASNGRRSVRAKTRLFRIFFQPFSSHRACVRVTSSLYQTRLPRGPGAEALYY